MCVLSKIDFMPYYSSGKKLSPCCFLLMMIWVSECGGWVHEWVREWVCRGWVDEWVSVWWVGGWASEWAIERASERSSEWVSERASERVCLWVTISFKVFNSASLWGHCNSTWWHFELPFSAWLIFCLWNIDSPNPIKGFYRIGEAGLESYRTSMNTQSR